MALNSKIPPGKSADDRCEDEIIVLLDQAEHLNKKDPNAGREAQHILEKFDETVRKIKSEELREEYASLRSKLESLFKGIL